MSLINRMLSDLEERKGGNLRNVDQAIDGLRATPVPQRPRKKRIPPATLAMALAIVALLALCGYLFWSRSPALPTPPAATVAETPAPPPSTAGATLPVPATAVPATPPPQPVVVTDVPPVATAATPSAAAPASTGAAPATDTPGAGARAEPPAAAEPEARPERRQPVLAAARSDDHEEPLVDTGKPATKPERSGAEARFRIEEAAPPPTADQAVALLEAGDAAGAESLLREGMEKAPGDASMARVLGHILLSRDAAAEAVRVLRPAAPTVASDPDFHALLAAAEQRSGAHADAARRYRALLTTAPGNGAWLVGLGISLQALGNAQEAADAFLQALADPSLPAPLHDFAMQQSTQVRGRQP